MEKNRLSYLITFFIFIVSLSVKAQWEQTEGPYGATFLSTCSIGTRMYATTSIGVYYSDDNGQSWKLTSKQPDYNEWPNTPKILTDGTTLYYSNQNGVFVSNDQGTSWATITSLPTSDIMVTNKGIYMAFSNNSLTFLDKIQNISTVVSIKSSAIFADRLERKGDTLFAGGSGKVYRSFNNGLTWDFVTPPLPSGEGVAGLHVFDTTLFVGGRFSGFFLSKDWGKTWHACTTGISSNFNVLNYAFYNAGKRIYLIPGEEIYYSDNEGGTWSQANTFPTWDATTIGGNGQVIWAGAGNGGAYIYNPTTNTWTVSANNGLLNSNIPVIDKSGPNIIAGVSIGGIYYSSDEGNTWGKSKGISVGSNRSPLIFMQLGNFHLAGKSDGLFISFDNGKSYSSTSMKEDIYALCKSKNYLWCYQFGLGLYKSPDSAATWIGVPPNNDYSIQFYGMVAQDTVLYANRIGGDTSIYRSLDEGKTWKGFTNGLSAPFTVNKICSTPHSVLLATTSGLYKLSSDKSSWKHVLSMPQNCSYLYYDNSTVFASTSGNPSYVYSSSDYGTTWSQFTDSIPDIIYSLVLSPSGKLFAGTSNNSVWKYSNQSTVTSLQEGLNIPQTGMNVYPNPTENTITINVPFDNSELEIIDLAGNKMMTQSVSRGSHIVNMETPKGIYVVKVSNFEKTYSQRVVVR